MDKKMKLKLLRRTELNTGHTTYMVEKDGEVISATISHDKEKVKNLFELLKQGKEVVIVEIVETWEG